MTDPRRVFLVSVFYLLVLLILITILGAVHAQAAQDSCFDELLVRWNEFASDANNHMHVTDARPGKHEKQHTKLEKEWEALHALACW